MYWPQITFLVILILSSLFRILNFARKPDTTPGEVVAALFIETFWYAGVVFLLHQGGFW